MRPANDVEEGRLAPGERLDLDPVGHQDPQGHVAGADRRREQRTHLHLAGVPGQVPQQALEVRGVEGLAAVEHEAERVRGEGSHAIGDELGRAFRRAQVGLLALPVDVEVEDGVGGEGRVGHRHEPRQGLAQLGGAVELARATALLRDLRAARGQPWSAAATPSLASRSSSWSIPCLSRASSARVALSRRFSPTSARFTAQHEGRDSRCAAAAGARQVEDGAPGPHRQRASTAPLTGNGEGHRQRLRDGDGGRRARP